VSTKPKSTLGRGLDSFFDSGFQEALLDKTERITEIELSQISARKDQPRKTFDQKSILELASTIDRNGLLQPIIVSKKSTNKYEIIAGERRYRAYLLLGRSKIPSIIRDISEASKYELALLENIQRVNLSPIEQAVAIEDLHTKFQLEYTEIANRLGKSASAISNAVRLLKLPKVIIEAVSGGELSEGHARTLLSLQSLPSQQIELFKNILKMKLSVRKTEILAAEIKQAISTKTIAVPMPLKNRAKMKSGLLSKEVFLESGVSDSGYIRIDFKDKSELQKLARKLLLE
jgi:ParB family transcriptional regulator, chromosome partitioning protein